MQKRLQEILLANDGVAKGDLKDIELLNFDHFSNAKANSIIWLKKSFVDNNPQLFKNYTAKINCLVTDSEELCKNIDAKVYLLSPNPQLIFALLYNASIENTTQAGFIHPTAVIHPEAKIEPSVFIGPLSYIGKAEIKKNCHIAGGVFIKDDVFIGENCKIDAGVVIGVEGTGHVKNKEGKWLQFPQVGITIIEDDVEIGANTYVTRGALGITHIKKGAKIGLDCGIGHNVTIEENVLVIAKSLIGGSSLLKKNSFIGMKVLIRDGGLVIGENVKIGMGSIVTKNIPDNEVWFGSPAKFYKTNDES